MQSEVEDFLFQEWLAISQAPISFIASVIVATALVWLVMQWAYAVRIDNLRSAIEAKAEEIALLDTRIRETREAFEAAQGQVDRLSRRNAVPIVDLSLGDRRNCRLGRKIEVTGEPEQAEQRLEAEVLTAESLSWGSASECTAEVARVSRRLASGGHPTNGR